MKQQLRPQTKQAFTLIELSIVLVILGLLVGGVLQGKALIYSAALRAQLTQVNQMVAGARTFRAKYLDYPGDLPATNFTSLPGGVARKCWDGQGGGNGDGLITMGPGAGGESSLFMNDITLVGLFPGKYTYIYPSNGCVPGSDLTAQTGSAIATYYPPAKLGGDLYLYVWSGGPAPLIWSGWGADGKNYITIAGLTQVCGGNACGTFRSNATMKVFDAYTMDTKMDDGMPQTGAVTATFINTLGFGGWAGTEGGLGTNDQPNTTATAGSASTCYDNDNTGGTKHHYSIGQNAGEGKNCALSFKFR